MKNKQALLLFVLLALPALASAQQVTVSEAVTIRDDISYQIVTDGQGNVVLVEDKGYKLSAQGFDPQMRKRWEKELELDKKSPQITDVTSLNDGDFCVIYQFRQKLHPVLKVHRYSIAANLTDSVTIKHFEEEFYPPHFEVVYSEDKNTALIWFVKDLNLINALAFDLRTMEVRWEKSFQPDGVVYGRDFSQVLLDNAGNMYLVLKKDNFKSKQQSHYIEVLYYGPNTSESPQRHAISMGGNLTFDVFFTFDNLHQALRAGGLYASDNLSRADGFFCLTIPFGSSQDSLLLRFHPFEEAFVHELLEKEKVKHVGLPEVSVQEVVLRKDGGMLLFGELNKSVQRGGTGYNGGYSRSGFRPIVDHYYDDVFLISIHPNGEVHWKSILHKKQYSQDDDAIYSSFFVAKTPTALRVIFNDEIKAENMVSEYVVKGNGELDRNAVMTTERKELQLRFRDAIQASANELLVPSERRGRLKLVRIVY